MYNKVQELNVPDEASIIGFADNIVIIRVILIAGVNCRTVITRKKTKGKQENETPLHGKIYATILP